MTTRPESADEPGMCPECRKLRHKWRHLSDAEFSEQTGPAPTRATDPPPLYVYFIEGYDGPVKSTELRPGIVFDTAPDNRLIGIEIYEYARLTVDGRSQPPDTGGAAEPQLLEKLDDALMEWWDDADGRGNHACRPRPSEAAFMALLQRRGLTVTFRAALTEASEVRAAGEEET